MSKDTILAIRHAEEEAEKLREHARVAADALIKDAGERAAKVTEAADAETRRELAETLEKIRKKVADKEEAALADVRDELAALEKTAESNMRSAVKKIFWEITEKCQ